MRENLSAIETSIRGTKRFKTKQRALIYCHQDNEPVFHHLIDISLEGLSFRYLNTLLETNSINKVSLFYNSTPVVKNIPVQIVSDQPLKERSLIPIRRASLLFEAMDGEQERHLRYFIRKYTEQQPA
jgi:hypothetical protein